jgi:hypothetical protein
VLAVESGCRVTLLQREAARFGVSADRFDPLFESSPRGGVLELLHV